MGKTIRIIAFFILIATLSSCWLGRKKIIDEYEVTWGDYFNQGWEGYTISCGLCSESAGPIENIKGISWNEKVIIVEKNNLEDVRWYAFIAAGDTLQCCNGDSLLGPFTKIQIDSIVRVNNYTNLNEKIYVE